MEIETYLLQNCLTVLLFQQKTLFEIQDDSGIAIRESIRYFVEKIFSDINACFHAPEQQLIFG